MVAAREPNGSPSESLPVSLRWTFRKLPPRHVNPREDSRPAGGIAMSDPASRLDYSAALVPTNPMASRVPAIAVTLILSEVSSTTSLTPLRLP